MKTVKPWEDFYTTFWNENIDEDMDATADLEWRNEEKDRGFYESYEEFIQNDRECYKSQFIYSIQIMNDYVDDETNEVEPQDGILLVFEPYDRKGNPVYPDHFNHADTDGYFDDIFLNTFSSLLDADFAEELGNKLIEAAKKVKDNIKEKHLQGISGKP